MFDLTFQQFIFYLFSGVIILSAVSMVTVRNPVYAALFLILTFFTSAALWVLLEAEFLGVVLVLVYVGAVMVLFLFVIMMLDVNLAQLKEGFVRILPVGLLISIVVATEMIIVLNAANFSIESVKSTEVVNNTEALGSILYTDYVYPFEIAAVILVVAIIAAISLAMRSRPETKYQNPATQVRVKREQRVRLVKVETEKEA